MDTMRPCVFWMKRVLIIWRRFKFSGSKVPYRISAGDIKIGFISFAEHEFTIASENTPGANPFNEEDAIRVIHSLKNECDYVVALYHGGIEHYRYPSPQLQHRCRRLVDSGADYVICQHSHCIGCYETYDNSTIVYGQGISYLMPRN
mgnify:CR=1 FL=1